MSLTDRDIADATDLRHCLHAMPEISGEERETAAVIAACVGATQPDRLITGLGGNGVAAVYDSGSPGPVVLFRAELDALPIMETGTPAYRSTISGKGHMCGHDGHMAILTVLAGHFGRERPGRGKVVLMFQPAEETGAGAAAVIADRRFGEIAPDYSFSLHNFPSLPLGHVWLKQGTANCASRGLKITLTGRTAHASMPETGISPMPAMAMLMPTLTALSRGSIAGDDLVLLTVTHAVIGEPAFGIAPGHAELWVTLRTMTDDTMQALVETAEGMVERLAGECNLRHAFEYHDVFQHSRNDAQAVAALKAAMDAEGIVHEAGEALRASEDFGRFGAVSQSAMFFLGAGETTPALHSPNYDFPDDLIPIGARIFIRTARDLLGRRD